MHPLPKGGGFTKQSSLTIAPAASIEFLSVFSGSAIVEQEQFFENTERDNEVKRDYSLIIFEVFSSCRATISRQNEYNLRRESSSDSRREREQERTEDALASESEEGRGKLRKAPGICKQELIRRCPNGGTPAVEGCRPSIDGANAGN